VDGLKRKAKAIFSGANDSDDDMPNPKRRKTNPKDIIKRARNQLKGSASQSRLSNFDPSHGKRANGRQASVITLDSRTSSPVKKKRHSSSATMTVSQFNNSRAKKLHRQSMPALGSSSARGNKFQVMKSNMKNAINRTKIMTGSSKNMSSNSRSSSLSKSLLSNSTSAPKEKRQTQLQTTAWGTFTYAIPEPTVEDEMRKIAEGKGNVSIPKRTSSLNAAKAIEKVVNQDKRPSTARSMKSMLKGAKLVVQGEQAINKTIRVVSGAE
jgi:hypothetical protein